MAEGITFETLTLPSRGECYPHKKGTVDVAYLTASDENIIFSDKLREEGRMTDVLLERKIVDKTFTASELCTGDREYILLWLRITGYGNEYHIHDFGGVATIDLSDIKFKEFNYFGDTDGYFDYLTCRRDAVKYHLLTRSEEKTFTALVADPEHRKGENESMRLIKTLLSMATVSVNGCDDREKVEMWIDTLEEGELMRYLSFFCNNNAGVDSHTSHGIELGDELFDDIKINSRLFREE